jgi:hypothetical protein
MAARPGKRPSTSPDTAAAAADVEEAAVEVRVLGQLLTDDHHPLRSRVAACLMLLFAQPATRIVPDPRRHHPRRRRWRLHPLRPATHPGA